MRREEKENIFALFYFLPDGSFLLCLHLLQAFFLQKISATLHFSCFQGRVDQLPQEDFEVRFREQGGYRTNGEYTYNGWRNIYIMLQFIIETCTSVIV